VLLTRFGRENVRRQGSDFDWERERRPARQREERKRKRSVVLLLRPIGRKGIPMEHPR
jgi:hypothetical protein